MCGKQSKCYLKPFTLADLLPLVEQENCLVPDLFVGCFRGQSSPCVTETSTRVALHSVLLLSCSIASTPAALALCFFCVTSLSHFCWNALTNAGVSPHPLTRRLLYGDTVFLPKHFLFSAWDACVCLWDRRGGFCKKEMGLGLGRRGSLHFLFLL